MNEEARLKGAVTRTRRKADRIETEFGGVDIPKTHPLWTKRDQARTQARTAMQNLLDYRAAGTKRVPSSGKSKPDRGDDPNRKVG